MTSEIEILKKDIRIVTRAKKNSPANITIVIPDKVAEQLLLATLSDQVFMSMKIQIETEVTS